MSEDTSAASAAPEGGAIAAEETTDVTTEAPIDWEAETKKVREEAARHRTQKQEARKQAEALTAEVAELQKAVSVHDDAVSKNAELTSSLNKITAVIEAGFDVEDLLDAAGRIRGETSEELIEDAQKLKGLMQKNAAPKNTSPRPDPSQGAPARPQLTGLAGVIAQASRRH